MERSRDKKRLKRSEGGQLPFEMVVKLPRTFSPSLDLQSADQDQNCKNAILKKIVTA